MRDGSNSDIFVARRRLLDAALQLASEGGYDALQVRAIAARARVSSRTIYEHFASLDALLIVAVAEHTARVFRRYVPPTGDTPAARVNRLVGELTDMMIANGTLTIAVLRAMLSGKPDVATHLRDFRTGLTAILTSAIAPEQPTTGDYAVAEILEDIWFAALVGWASGTDPDSHTRHIMRRATLLLLPAGRSPGSGNQGLDLSDFGYRPSVVADRATRMRARGTS